MHGKELGCELSPFISKVSLEILTTLSRYITPNVDSAGIIRGSRLSNAELRDLQRNARVYRFGARANPGVLCYKSRQATEVTW
jgi:hypothetical protein